jgi:hypothetical protein
MIDTEKFYTDIDKIRRTKRLRWNQLAREVSVSASTLSRLGHGETRMTAITFGRLLLWSGLDFKEYMVNGQSDNP